MFGTSPSLNKEIYKIYIYFSLTKGKEKEKVYEI